MNGNTRKKSSILQEVDHSFTAIMLRGRGCPHTVIILCSTTRPRCFKAFKLCPSGMFREFKVMLLGDSCTGKTCLLVRYKDGAFLNNNFISTVGIDYRNKVIDLDNKKVKLQIWDTAGQERFRSVTSSYYRDADALLLVFDISNRTSFENIRSWLGEIKEYGKEHVQVILVGNKCDLGNSRMIRSEEARHLATSYNIPYIETSAKTGHNVSQAFIDVTRRLLSASTGTKYEPSSVVDLVTSEPTYRCCSGLY